MTGDMQHHSASLQYCRTKVKYVQYTHYSGILSPANRNHECLYTIQPKCSYLINAVQDIPAKEGTVGHAV